MSRGMSITNCSDGWNAKRLKHLKRERLMYGANELSESSDPSWPRFIRITDINDDGSLRDDELRSLPRDIAEPYLLEDGDLLFARSGATVGKTFVYSASMGPACFAGYLIRFRADLRQMHPQFLKYFTESAEYAHFIRQATIQATIQNVSAERYGELKVPAPDLGCQQRIIGFLDAKLAQLDELISKKERQLELLGEKRQALISHTVTRGLNPEAPTKPSGFPWLGEIPIHWATPKLNWLATLIQTGPFGSQLHFDDYVEDGVPVINPVHIQGDSIIADSRTSVSPEVAERLARHAMKAGDIVIGRRGEMGRCAVVSEEQDGWLCGTGSMMIRVSLAKAVPKFIANFISSPVCKAILLAESVGTTMDNLNPSIVGNLRIPFPPLVEQRELLQILQHSLNKSDQVAKKVQSQIEKLREFRQALITAAVTGQLAVPEEVA